MDAARWELVQELFHAVADLEPAKQRRALKAACSGDAELFDQVSALLHADAEGGLFLDRDVAEVAHAMIGNSAVLPTHGFGPYRVTGILGEGGMGVVYLARRDDLGSEAAIKILRDAWLSPARRERFAS